MAVNSSRSMNLEFFQGTTDSSYITLTPDRGNPVWIPYDRLTWPTYGQAERHQDPSHREGHAVQSARPVEYKVRPGLGEARY